MRLQNKVCAISGAGAGIGRAAAERFAEEGANVFLLEINEQTGKETEERILRRGGKAVFINCDVSNDLSVQAAFAQIAAKAKTLNVLYNNASVYLGGKDGKITNLEPAVWKKVLAINLDSIFFCCRHAIPLLLAAGGGSIINTASSAGVIGIPKCDAYTASKGATIALTRSLAVEYGPEGIRTNCIAPAAIASEMIKQSNPEGDDFDANAFIKLRTPLRRWGKPEEIASLAVFLASSESSYLNGAIIAADGGITINGDLSKVSPQSPA